MRQTNESGPIIRAALAAIVVIVVTVCAMLTVQTIATEACGSVTFGSYAIVAAHCDGTDSADIALGA